MCKTEEKVYLAIDLKSFYASVECTARGLNPLTTNLVVADNRRTEKTICLAVTPSLKAYGIPGRARLFEVIQKVEAVNAKRRALAKAHTFVGKSADAQLLAQNPNLELDYIIAPPRMAHYIACSSQIYNIYLKYIAPEDMHVYSIDEVFMDVTAYLRTYNMTAEELAQTILQDVLQSTGITATAGIGSNLYLCKIAMDIVAKHIEPDENGVRIARLDELSYRKLLWTHRPLTDFWRVGKGYAKKLEANGIYTMGDIARCSCGSKTDYYNEDLLYRLFGINAELLIDHAWGYEPCTIAEIKAYKPSTKSLCSGQVLQNPYTFEQAELVVKEMTDLLVLDLVDQALATNQIVLTVGYDIENLKNSKTPYRGETMQDPYGRTIPKHAHGTASLPHYTSSTQEILDAVTKLYRNISKRELSVRRITVTANHLVRESELKGTQPEQLSLFENSENTNAEATAAQQEKEKNMQKALLTIKKKFGKNSILKGMNLEEGATAASRNQQIGGHKA